MSKIILHNSSCTQYTALFGSLGFLWLVVCLLSYPLWDFSLEDKGTNCSKQKPIHISVLACSLFSLINNIIPLPFRECCELIRSEFTAAFVITQPSEEVNMHYIRCTEHTFPSVLWFRGEISIWYKFCLFCLFHCAFIFTEEHSGLQCNSLPHCNTAIPFY